MDYSKCEDYYDFVVKDEFGEHLADFHYRSEAFSYCKQLIAKMKTTTNVTQVKFLIEKDSEQDVFAYFPEERVYPNEQKLRTSYAHIGQHSACHEDYANDCQPATPEQYADLRAELESIGYNLEIL